MEKLCSFYLKDKIKNIWTQNSEYKQTCILTSDSRAGVWVCTLCVRVCTVCCACTVFLCNVCVYSVLCVYCLCTLCVCVCVVCVCTVCLCILCVYSVCCVCTMCFCVMCVCTLCVCCMCTVSVYSLCVCVLCVSVYCVCVLCMFCVCVCNVLELHLNPGVCVELQVQGVVSKRYKDNSHILRREQHRIDSSWPPGPHNACGSCRTQSKWRLPEMQSKAGSNRASPTVIGNSRKGKPRVRKNCAFGHCL